MHRIYGLGVLTTAINIRVRESLDPMISLDDTRFATSVTRQSRMTFRMNIAGTDALTDIKSRRYRHLEHYLRDVERQRRGVGWL